MRIFLIFTISLLVCVHTNISYAQNCAGQVDSAYLSVSPAHCATANGEIIIANVRGGIINPVQTKLYQLNGGTGQASNVFPNLAAGNYTLVITEQPSGCKYTYPVAIIVGNKSDFTTPTETHTNVTTCNGSDGSINIIPTGGIPPHTYQLDGNAPQNNATILNVTAGTHYVTIKDSKGCDTVLTVTIPDLNGISFASFITYPTACNSNTGSVKIKSTTGTAPVTMQIDGGAAIAYTDTIIGLAQGNHKIILIDATGCKFTLNTIYISLKPPYKDFTVHVVTDTCSKNVGKIFLTNNAGGAVPATFALDASTIYSANASFNNLPKGMHILHIKDNNGCTKDTTLTIPTTAKPQGSITTLLPTCGLTDGAINVTNVTGAMGPYTLTCNGTNTNGANPFINLPKGTYAIKITDAFNCDSTQQVLLDEKNKITSINALLTNITCGSNLGSINVISVGGGVPAYTYSFNGAAQASTTKSSLQQGTYVIHIADANNCVYDTAVTLTQTNPYTCTLTALPSTIFTSETSTLTAVTGGSINVWTGAGAETTTGTSVTVAPLVTTLYTLNSSTPEGCIATCSTTVIVQPKIVPYKAFTPNDDGKNDKWEITYISYYPNAEINVFTRWGERVYQKKKDDTYVAFDGKSGSGKNLTTGTYFYVINLNVDNVGDDFNFYKGFIEIIQ